MYPLITYHLAVDERSRRPIVVREWLRWKRGRYGAPFHFLSYKEGIGRAASGEAPDTKDERVATPLKSPDFLAVNALGQFKDHREWRRCGVSSWVGMCPVSPRTVSADSRKRDRMND